MRILVIEDDKATARNVLQILKNDASYVAIVGSGEQGIERSRNQWFDLVILDLTLPDMHGLEVLRKLRAENIVLPVLILTGDHSKDMLARCLEAGADDYLTKPFHASELVARVHTVIRRAARSTKTMVEWREANEKLATLTVREREVMDVLVARGSNKAAAQELGISTRTVETHRARVMEKLNARKLTDLVRIALSATSMPGDDGAA